MSGRTASFPATSSKARRTASLLKVPPCTIIFLPMLSVFLSFITLKRAFLMTEYESPLEMSPTLEPSFWACLTLLFIKTVQRLPRSTGSFARRARAENSSIFKPRERAKLSRKLPQPEEQASFN